MVRPRMENGVDLDRRSGRQVDRGVEPVAGRPRRVRLAQEEHRHPCPARRHRHYLHVPGFDGDLRQDGKRADVGVHFLGEGQGQFIRAFRRGHEHRLDRPVALVADVESDAALVRELLALGDPGLLVVHSRHDVGARRQTARGAVLSHARPPRRPERQRRGGGEVASLRVSESRPVVLGVERARGPGRIDVDRDVADDRGCPRHHVGAGHEPFLGRPGRQHEVADRLVRAPVERERLRHSQLDGGCAQRPRFGLSRRRRTLRARALRVAAAGPLEDHVHLVRRQRVPVPEIAEPVLRLPRRHPQPEHLLADRLGPGIGAAVGHERHRGDTPVAMAGPAVVAEDREQVLVVVPPRGDRRVGLRLLDLTADRDERHRCAQTPANVPRVHLYHLPGGFRRGRLQARGQPAPPRTMRRPSKLRVAATARRRRRTPG